MASNPVQHAYRAPCPGCGAPVEFRAAQSTHAICAYCQSTVVRKGETLARIGKMAELFDDQGLLQLQASGTWQGQAFTLVGRLQYRYAEGSWTEWHALFADGTVASLSEDNGAFVFMRAQSMQRALPAPEFFRVGAGTAINGKPFVVASNEQVTLVSAQGELPRLPELGRPFTLVELRSRSAEDAAHGGAAEVLSVDYSAQPATVSVGHAVLLDELQMSGLRDASVKNESARQFSCPQCGGALAPLLLASKSMTCPACHSIVDLAAGIGGELRHASQDEPVAPLIDLGSVGQLQGLPWQVVGYQHRMGVSPGDSDEQFGWDEYLLYNAMRGFIFLVDSSDGWSLVKPATGAPEISSDGRVASYLGTRYQLRENYIAETDYVLGEFYWQVQRGQKTSNQDFVNGKHLLSLEQSRNERTWSVGATVGSELVVKAFALEAKRDVLKRSDVSAFSASASVFRRPDFWLFVAVLLVVLVLVNCTGKCDPYTQTCSTYARTAGGSYGGFSTGGGHK